MENPSLDINNIVENLSEEKLKELRTLIKKKSKYQKKGIYREKENKVRFFNPDEWEKFILSTHLNIKLRFYYQFLMLTGMRYKEAKNVKVVHIDKANKQIMIMKPKGGVQRFCHLSSYTLKILKQRMEGMNKEDTFNFPTIQHLIQTMKRICEKEKLYQWNDFSAHNLRKTHENYLLALDKDEVKVSRHMGHTPKTAQEHYLSSGFIKDKKQLDKIRKWLEDIF